MQSNRGRVALALAAVAAAVVAFLVLRPGDDDQETATQPPTEEAASSEEEGPRSDGTDGPSGEAAGAETFQIDAASGEVMDVEVSKGDEVRLVVRADAEEEVHVHGYNEFADVAPGEPAELEFVADIEGIYEIELEGSHTQIAELEVRP